MRPDVPGATLRAPTPSVTAVVPARNEADVVGSALASLAAQQYPGDFRIILVDDASQDGTAAIALQAAPQLHLVTARPLPAGWTGKMWAVAEGVRAAAGRLPAAHRRRYRAPARSSGGTGGALAARRLRPGVVHGPPAMPDARRTGADSRVRILFLPALSAGLDSRFAAPHRGRRRRLHTDPPRGPRTHRRDRAHTRRTDRRLRPRACREAKRRTRLARAERHRRQHPSIPDLRRNRPHDFAHGLHPARLLRPRIGRNRGGTGIGLSRAALVDARRSARSRPPGWEPLRGSS